MMSEESKQIILGLLNEKIDSNKATKLHLSHQYELPKNFRILPWSDEEIRRENRNLAVTLIPLEKALKEFQNANTEISQTKGLGNTNPGLPNQ